MSTNKRLSTTIFTSILSLLIVGCGEQSEPEMQQQGENVYQQESEPAGISPAEIQEQELQEQQSQNEDMAGQSSTTGSERVGESERMKHQQPSFSQLDTDQDGYLNREEAQAFEDLALRFEYLDQNKDEKVDSKEFGAFKSMQMHGFEHGQSGGFTEPYGQRHTDHPEGGKGPELPAKQQDQDKGTTKQQPEGSATD